VATCKIEPSRSAGKAGWRVWFLPHLSADVIWTNASKSTGLTRTELAPAWYASFTSPSNVDEATTRVMPKHCWCNNPLSKKQVFACTAARKPHSPLACPCALQASQLEQGTPTLVSTYAGFSDLKEWIADSLGPFQSRCRGKTIGGRFWWKAGNTELLARAPWLIWVIWVRWFGKDWVNVSV